jgi:hypothetical protein
MATVQDSGIYGPRALLSESERVYARIGWFVFRFPIPRPENPPNEPCAPGR